MEANAASQATSSPGAARAVALQNLWQWVRRAVTPRKIRRLRVCETLSLGERRFLAVIEFDRQEFLVGGSGNSLELLARLDEGEGDPRTFRAAGVAGSLRAGESCLEINSPPRRRRSDLRTPTESIGLQKSEGLRGGEYGSKRAGQPPPLLLPTKEGNRVDLL